MIYILALLASTTATEELRITSLGRCALTHAFITSDSLPTPDGSIIILSGAYLLTTSLSAVAKSPTREQQIQPEFISVISIPASLRKPESTPISPNSFSISTTFCPLSASERSFLIRVVFPAPRKPDTTSILVIISSLSYQTSKQEPPTNSLAIELLGSDSLGIPKKYPRNLSSLLASKYSGSSGLMPYSNGSA